MHFIIAMAQPPGGAQGGSTFAAFMPLILMFFVLYFLLMRPQQKKQMEHQKMLAGMEKGDKVITSGGIHGTIVNVKENIVTVKIAENVRIDVSRGNISVVKKEKEPAA